MHLCTVQDLAIYGGGRLLFKNLSFGIKAGDRIAIIARNGKGKSSLLDVLGGARKPDFGTLTFRNAIRIAYLPQSPTLLKNHSALTTALSFVSDKGNILNQYYQSLENSDVDEAARLSFVIEEQNLWETQARTVEFLHKLGIVDPAEKVGNLSGGQQRRVCLAGVLASEANIIILDEPTNHLDVGLIEWMENTIQASPAAFLIVSHDRKFLDNTANRILEIDQEKVFQYDGNYTAYKYLKELRIKAEASSREKSENILRREKIWASRQPKARGTKSKSRLNKFEQLKEQLSYQDDRSRLNLGRMSSRLGTKVLELHNISLVLDKRPILKKFSYNFKPGEKVALTGTNGSGKSSFVKLLTGEWSPTTGKIVRGETVILGYMAQNGIPQLKEQPIIDFIREIAEGVEFTQKEYLSAAELLKRFDFAPDRHYELTNSLSGGEKKRLYLLSILIQKPNLLILDEPANELDHTVLEKLEDYLSDYCGTVIFVSHDRAFIERLADTTFIFTGDGNIHICPGAYIKAVAPKLTEEKATTENFFKSIRKNNPIRNSLTYKEQKELLKLEEELPQIENEINNLNEIILRGNIPYPELNEKIIQLKNLSGELNLKTERWIELEEKKSLSKSSNQEK